MEAGGKVLDGEIVYRDEGVGQHQELLCLCGVSVLRNRGSDVNTNLAGPAPGGQEDGRQASRDIRSLALNGCRDNVRV